MLMNIPIISPIDLSIKVGEPGVRMLPAPDYEVHALPAAAILSAETPTPPEDPAVTALNEIELAAQISEYHDFSWWDERIRQIRERLKQDGAG
jgi:hypothetical protein